MQKKYSANTALSNSDDVKNHNINKNVCTATKSANLSDSELRNIHRDILLSEAKKDNNLCFTKHINYYLYILYYHVELNHVRFPY